MIGGRRTDDHAVCWHVLGCNLKPAARGRTEIDTAARRLEKSIFLVELDELEGRAGAVSLLSLEYRSWRCAIGMDDALCKFIILVETTFAGFLLGLAHGSV